MGKFDEIFDDVVVNAKAAASAVSKKASSVYDTSKHKITAAELRGEINKKLKDLGALTYKAQVHNVDLCEDIATLVSEITDLKDSLAVINEHIANSKTGYYEPRYHLRRMHACHCLPRNHRPIHLSCLCS